LKCKFIATKKIGLETALSTRFSRQVIQTEILVPLEPQEATRSGNEPLQPHLQANLSAVKPWWILLVPVLIGAYAVTSRATAPKPRTYTPAQLESLMQGVFVSARPAIVRLQTLGVEDAPPTKAGSGFEIQNIVVAEGRATGFFISKDGYVLTAYHAVSGQSRFNVLTTTQELLPAVVVGFDESRDLALLKATTNRTVPFLPLETARGLKPGEPLVEVGNAEDDFMQPRYGTVQEFVQDSGELIPTRLVYSSVVLNPGDSGGAVLDFYGKAVAVGIGFAVSDTSRVSLLVPLEGLAANIADMKRGTQTRLPGVGLHIVHSDADGVKIDRVEPGSSAAAAGLQAERIVTSVDGETIYGQSDYYTAIRKKKIGERVQIIVRESANKTSQKSEYTLELR
jgi:serine protease Do